MARWYIGGLLAHAPSLLAFTNPTTNSYRRLVPGYEAPINLVYCAAEPQRRASGSRCSRRRPATKRLEFRTPDPTCNPYLAFSAMLMAGLDGIKNKIEPPEPMDKDLYDLPPEEKAMVKQVPGSLEEVLDNLEADHQWLLEGGVFTQDVIDTWIEYKRTHELDAVRLRPHPYEFHSTTIFELAATGIGAPRGRPFGPASRVAGKCSSGYFQPVISRIVALPLMLCWMLTKYRVPVASKMPPVHSAVRSFSVATRTQPSDSRS